MNNQVNTAGGRTPRVGTPGQAWQLHIQLVFAAISAAFFLYACAPAISSEDVKGNEATEVKTGDSVSKTSTADTQGSTSDKIDRKNQTLKSLDDSEMRMISGKEGLTIDTQQIDRTVEKNEILGDNGENNTTQTVTFAPIDVDLTVGRFSVEINTDEELTDGPQEGTIESEIPSIEGQFTIGVLMPGSTNSLGKFGMRVDYPGGGKITVKRQ